MLNRDEYAKALWAWFIERAKKPGRWGYESIGDEAREHLLECGIDVERSSLPEVGSTSDWHGTEAGMVRIPAITSDGWGCNCGTYGSRNLKLFIPGETPIAEVIYEVIQKALEG